MKYRKKPVLVDAIELTQERFDDPEMQEIREFMDSVEFGPLSLKKEDVLTIFTLEGDMKASIGDFIIKGVEGEFYPCKPDIFWETYESVPLKYR